MKEKDGLGFVDKTGDIVIDNISAEKYRFVDCRYLTTDEEC